MTPAPPPVLTVQYEAYQGRAWQDPDPERFYQVKPSEVPGQQYLYDFQTNRRLGTIEQQPDGSYRYRDFQTGRTVVR